MIKLNATSAALAVVLLGAAVAGSARADTPSPARSALGDWLYDSNGSLLGSVYAITDNDRTVVLQIGSYLTPGRKLVAVPASDIAVVGSHAVLTGSSAADPGGLPSIG
jgi:hypothetical protein